MSKYRVISGPCFPVFGPEITPKFDTFHAVNDTEKYHCAYETITYSLYIPLHWDAILTYDCVLRNATVDYFRILRRMRCCNQFINVTADSIILTLSHPGDTGVP